MLPKVGNNIQMSLLTMKRQKKYFPDPKSDYYIHDSADLFIWLYKQKVKTQRT